MEVACLWIKTEDGAFSARKKNRSGESHSSGPETLWPLSGLGMGKRQVLQELLLAFNPTPLPALPASLSFRFPFKSQKQRETGWRPTGTSCKTQAVWL